MMWNDTDIPFAYLITFRSYGTWLHGDIRGSVARYSNAYGSPRVGHKSPRKAFEKALLNREPVFLNAAMRHSVEFAIRETCKKRDWGMIAMNVKTNHAHSVISTGLPNAASMLNALKANATRVMRTDGCWTSDETPWVKGGSKRYRWNEESVRKAVEYVLYAQGDDLPDFV